MKISLRLKMTVAFAIVLLACMLGTGTALIRREQAVVRAELESRGQLIAQSVISGATNAIVTENLGDLNSLRRQLEGNRGELLYLRIWNRNAEPLTINDNFVEDDDSRMRVLYVLQQGVSTQRQVERDGRPVFESYAPLRIGKHTYAVVCAGFSLEPLAKREKQIAAGIGIVYGAALALALIASMVFAGFMTRPLKELTELTSRVATGELDHTASVHGRDEIAALGRAFNGMIAGLRERKFIKDTFSRYVTSQVAEELLRDPSRVSMGGVKQQVTVLFSDIRGFTAMSERLSPELVVSQLNEYFSAMIDIIFKYEGTLDKFVGDAIMAVFGAPITHEDDAARAVKTALEMQERLVQLNEKWAAEGRDRISIGVGINTGEAIAGNIGDMRRMEYTVIGFNVNLASRMENLTKKYGISVIISESTFQLVQDIVDARPLPYPVEIKGATMPMKVYEVVGWKN